MSRFRLEAQRRSVPARLPEDPEEGVAAGLDRGDGEAGVERSSGGDDGVVRPLVEHGERADGARDPEPLGEEPVEEDRGGEEEARRGDGDEEPGELAPPLEEDVAERSRHQREEQQQDEEGEDGNVAEPGNPERQPEEGRQGPSRGAAGELAERRLLVPPPIEGVLIRHRVRDDEPRPEPVPAAVSAASHALARRQGQRRRERGEGPVEREQGVGEDQPSPRRHVLDEGPLELVGKVPGAGLAEDQVETAEQGEGRGHAPDGPPVRRGARRRTLGEELRPLGRARGRRRVVDSEHGGVRAGADAQEAGDLGERGLPVAAPPHVAPVGTARDGEVHRRRLAGGDHGRALEASLDRAVLGLHLDLEVMRVLRVGVVETDVDEAVDALPEGGWRRLEGRPDALGVREDVAAIEEEHLLRPGRPRAPPEDEGEEQDEEPDRNGSHDTFRGSLSASGSTASRSPCTTWVGPIPSRRAA